MKNLKNTRKDTQDKWDNLIGNMGLTGSKATWMSQYAGLQSQTTTNTSSSFPSTKSRPIVCAATFIEIGNISVQPMSAPLGTLHYMDQYGNTKRTTRKKKINNIFKVNE